MLLHCSCDSLVCRAAFSRRWPAPRRRPRRTAASTTTPRARERRLPATQAQGPITLDGRLDEPSWAAAPLANDFVQNDPREGEPATFDTEVRLLYDDDALYIGVFAKDAEPGEIIVNELRKDFNTGTADGFQVVIDTFHDERNGYQFAINPAGAKWDSQMSNEGRDQNANWDGIWDVGTRIGEDGWYAEIEIPFRTLKFGPDDAADLGHQLPAPPAPLQREQLLVAAARASTSCRACRWPARSKACRACGRAPTSASSRTRSPARTRSPGVDIDRRFRRRLRREVRRDVGPDLGLHRQHRLLAGRGRRAADQPDALQPVLPREARLLPRELRRLPVRRRATPAAAAAAAAAADARTRRRT